MSVQYDHLSTFERDGFTVIVDKRWEEIDPWSQLSECFDSKEQLYTDIDSGKYDWFMLRVRVLFDEHEMGSHYLGGCLYEEASTVLTDGTVDDCLISAMEEARKEVSRLREKLAELTV